MFKKPLILLLFLTSILLNTCEDQSPIEASGEVADTLTLHTSYCIQWYRDSLLDSMISPVGLDTFGFPWYDPCEDYYCTELPNRVWGKSVNEWFVDSVHAYGVVLECSGDTCKDTLLNRVFLIGDYRNALLDSCAVPPELIGCWKISAVQGIDSMVVKTGMPCDTAAVVDTSWVQPYFRLDSTYVRACFKKSGARFFFSSRTDTFQVEYDEDTLVLMSGTSASSVYYAETGDTLKLEIYDELDISDLPCHPVPDPTIVTDTTVISIERYWLLLKQ